MPIFKGIRYIGELIYKFGRHIIALAMGLLAWGLMPYAILQSENKLLELVLETIGTAMSVVLVLAFFPISLVGVAIGGIIALIGGGLMVLGKI